jgi:4'-phosphopantetheinyl transferase
MGDAIHFVEARLDELPGDEGWLTPAETAVLADLRFEKRRADWRLGRWVAKHAVAAHGAAAGRSFASSAVGILAAEDGAPEAQLDGSVAPTVSISHAGGVGFAVAGRPGCLGCDVEVLEARSDAFTSDYFTTEELAFVRDAVGAEASRRANLVWSAKESALKALREGLRLDTRAVEVSWAKLSTPEVVADDGRWHPLEVRAPDDRTLIGWFRVSATHVWTVLADRPTELIEARS